MEVLMKFRIDIRENEGMFYATCAQVPGFLLCSQDMQSLDADILPAMKTLLSIKEQNQKKMPKGAPASDRLVAHRELAIAA
jgi:hypothetical protein